MIKRIIFENEFNGEMTIDLRNPEISNGLWIKSIKGIGPGKADINITDLASSDGGIFNSARSQTRNITFTIGIIQTNSASVEANRRNAYKWFGKKKPIKITFVTSPTLSGLEETETKFEIEGYVESNEPDIFNKQETMAISIVCPDPNFYPSNGFEEKSFSNIDDIFDFLWFEQSSDNPFIYGKIYYEKDENGVYFETEDEEKQIGKTYYVSQFSNELLEDEETEYFLTEDTEMKVGKEYFNKTSGQDSEYYLTPDTSFQSGVDYYEYNNKVIFGDLKNNTELIVDYDGDIEIGLTFIITIYGGNVSNLTVYKYLSQYTYTSFSFDDSAIPDGGFKSGDQIEVNTVVGNKYCLLIRNGHYTNIINALGRNPSWPTITQGTNKFTYTAVGKDYISMSINYRRAYEGI